MFDTLRSKVSSSQPDEADVLRRAMDRLYCNTAAREQISSRLRGRDVARMSESEIYTVIHDILRHMRLETTTA